MVHIFTARPQRVKLSMHSKHVGNTTTVKQTFKVCLGNMNLVPNIEKNLTWRYLTMRHNMTHLIIKTLAKCKIFMILLYVKIKVKLYHYCHAETKGERRYSSYSFLMSALDGGEWSGSCPGRALSPVPTE
jgi:hypothetical protein